MVYHYETEILKYVHFLLINLNEIFGAVMALIAALASEDYIKFLKWRIFRSRCYQIAVVLIIQYPRSRVRIWISILSTFSISLIIIGLALMPKHV